MAYASRDAHKLSPTGLAVTLTVNGGILAALFLAAPNITKEIEKTLIGYEVPLEKPPEPLPEPPKPQPQPRDERLTPLIEPLVPVPLPPDNPIIEMSDKPIIPLGPTFGTGDGVIVEPTPRPGPPVVTRPEIDTSVGFQPEYPANKVRMEEEGRVTVRVLVGANGRVLRVEPVGSPDADFFAATKRHALARWRFTPATRDGVKIEAWRELSLRFELDR